MLEIKPFQQTDSSRCGPAVLKMYLSYYGIRATEDELCERSGHTYENGCDDHGMKRALESYGLKVGIKNNSTYGDIQGLLENECPVIVDWFTPGFNLGPGDMPNGHSSIVVGLDSEKIHLLDPENASVRHIDREEFMRVFFDFRGRQGAVINRWEDMVIRQIMWGTPAIDREKQANDWLQGWKS